MKISNRLEYELVNLRRQNIDTKPLEQILRDLLDFEREYEEMELGLAMGVIE